MRICMKNNPAKFQLDPIWNDGALGLFENGLLNKNDRKNSKMSSDMRSVSDPNKKAELRTQRRSRDAPYTCF